ncbi:MAG: ribosome maturation factor RimP [Actinomycetota bacterium]
MAIVDRVTELVEPLLDPRGLSLYDVELNGGNLRVTVDGPDGVLLDDLAELTRALGRELEEHDPMPGSYTLEVSSPGLERKLRTVDHFRGAVDEDVNVKLVPSVEGDRRLRGVLVRVEGDHSIVLDVDGAEQTVLIADITKAVTVFEWGPAPKPGKAGSANTKNPNAEGDSGPEPERRAAAR